MLAKRILTAVVGIPLALLAVHLGGWWLCGVVAAVALAGMVEFYRLTAARRQRGHLWLGWPLGLAVIVLPHLRPTPSASLGIELPALILGLLALLVWAVYLFPRDRGDRVLATIVGVGYVAHLSSYLVRLRLLAGPLVSVGRSDMTFSFGEAALAGVLVICWGMDTAGYAVGKVLGRHRLCPNLSPGKSVEGAVGALLAAFLLGLALAGPLHLSLNQGAGLGLLIGVVGQSGDLFESLLKRRAGVKDSGALLPGHGGVLDRVDSLLLAAPAAFFYLRLSLGL